MEDKSALNQYSVGAGTLRSVDDVKVGVETQEEVSKP
jgi:hypothetical protein